MLLSDAPTITKMLKRHWELASMEKKTARGEKKDIVETARDIFGG